jgi:hypothetical protein
MGWPKESEESDAAWSQYRRAPEDGLKVWFGKEDYLNSWYTLCRAMELNSLHHQIIRSTHVNIVDISEWGRRSGGNRGVRVFEIQEEREHSIDKQKISHKIRSGITTRDKGGPPIFSQAASLLKANAKPRPSSVPGGPLGGGILRQLPFKLGSGYRG